MYECNLKQNRIGLITTKNLYKFKMAINEVTKEFEVVGKDGHCWGAGKSPKGALISACNCGIRLRDIDTYGVDVNGKIINEVISAIKN